ncbi:hypothetical protein BJ170DRAFT_578655 [Xylariales sp. AK1849]|nr:hypothetical protein BJ170DRAFT_578655 [Xylariales sp. AK1849]
MDPRSQSSVDLYSRPHPRPPRSPAHSALIRVRNRRREYLARHPSYVKSLEHELADPLLYDALVRRFQTSEEREKEGRTKGYSRVLEVDLLRGEARLSQLQAGQTPRPRTQQEGRDRWEDFLRQRFILGGDEDVDYVPIDTDDSLDVIERRDEEEAWFNDEEPRWASKQDVEGEEERLEGETGIQDF